VIVVEQYNSICKMLIIITQGSCLFGGCIYNVDSLMGVIPMLVIPVHWDDEKCTRCKVHTLKYSVTIASDMRNYQWLPTWCECWWQWR